MGLHNLWINQEIWSIILDEVKNRITDIYKLVCMYKQFKKIRNV